MSDDPQSRARHEISARDDSRTDPALSQPGGPCTTDGSVDPDGALDAPHRKSHDPYQPL